MKKKISLILAMTLIVGLLGGCGQSNSSSATSKVDSSSETSKVDSSSATSKVDLSTASGTVRMISYEPQFTSQQNEIVRQFNEKYPNIKVNIEYLGANVDDYALKTDNMVLAGEPIDLTLQSYNGGLSQRAANGSILSEDEYFKQEGTTAEKLYSGTVQYKGKTYGIPCDGKTFIVMLNKTDLDSVGLPAPSFDWTWDDFRMYAQKLTKGDGANKRYGAYFHIWPQYYLWPMYSTQMGTPLFTKGKLDISNPVYANFLKFRKDMQDVDKSVMPVSEVLSINSTYSKMFFSNKASMVVSLTGAVGDVKSSTYPHEFKTVFAPLPRADKNAPVGWRPYENRYLTIPKTSTNPQAAYLFARFYSTTGMNIKGAGFSCLIGADSTSTIDVMTDKNSSNLYDMTSLKNTLINPKIVNNAYDFVDPTVGTINVAYAEAGQSYLVGGGNIEDILSKFKATAQGIIDRAK